MRLVFASLLLSGCVLLRAGDCGGSAQTGGGGSGGTVNSGGLGGGGGGQPGQCTPGCDDTALCECVGFEGTSALCDVEVVQLEDVMQLGAIAVSGDAVAWVLVRDGDTLVGRRSASLSTADWAKAPESYGSVGAQAPDGHFGRMEGGGFFYRATAEAAEGFLCWPGEACAPATSSIKIRDLQVQAGRMAVAAGEFVCFTQLAQGNLQEAVASSLPTLGTQSASSCQGSPGTPEAPASAVRVDFADGDASRVWLTTRGAQGGAVHLVESVGEAPGDPIGVNVRATSAARACGDEPWTLLMKQCPNMVKDCSLKLLGADKSAPTTVVLPPGFLAPRPASEIAADRDYFYYSSPGNINVVVRSDNGAPAGASDGYEIPLTASDSAVLSMDASHEDYLFFTYQETSGSLEKFFLGRWRKQKRTPKP